MSNIKYDAVIGFNADGDAAILLYTFDHGGGRKGAVGAILELVQEDVFEERTSPENLREHWREYWAEEVASGNTNQRLTYWISQLSDPEEGIFDESYRGIVEDAGIEFVATNCISSGRIFPAALDDLTTILHPELIAIIREAEAENP